MAKVTIYTATRCGFCTAAKRLFDSKGVAYEEIDVTGDREARFWLMQQSGQRTVPQIFIDGRSYGGYQDVAALDRRGELEPLLH